jgi:hypothetical protein
MQARVVHVEARVCEHERGDLLGRLYAHPDDR